MLLRVICLLGDGDDGHAASDDDSELEDGEILASDDDSELEGGEIREPLCGMERTPQRRSPVEMSERSPPKRARLGLAGYEASRESGSMWESLRRVWERSERLSKRRGGNPGLGYKGFLSSRRDFGEWVPASKV